MEDKFSNQRGIFNPKEQRLKITIIGVGSSGSFIALTLAKMGFNDIEVIDFDSVELHNIPNQFYRMKDIGKLKTTAIQEIIKEFTDVDIIATNGILDEVTVNSLELSLNRLYIICVDNVETRRIIYNQLKGFPLLVIDGGLGGEEFHTQILQMDNKEHQVRYEEYLSSEGKDAPCGFRNVIYTILNESSEICNIVKRINNKEDVPDQLRRDMKTHRILTPQKEIINEIELGK